MHLTDVTEEEAQLYDRQIRLWGLEAQSRLKKSKILVIGVNGVSCEIIKNLVLAGIDTLDLCDCDNVDDIDINHNFLISRSSLGLNKAIAAKERTSQLNPRVNVTPYIQLPQEFAPNNGNNLSIDKYDIIILASSKMNNNWIDYDKKCIEMNKKFIAIDSFGWLGFSFFNLGVHEYYVKESTTNNTNETQDLTKETEFVHKTKRYFSFSDVTEIRWETEELKKKLKRTPKQQFVLTIVQRMVSREKRYLTTHDVQQLLNDWQSYSSDHGIDVKLVNRGDFEVCLGPGVVPVNSVLGGLVAQEIIKIVSGDWEPTGNFILFNGTTCAGDSIFINP